MTNEIDAKLTDLTEFQKKIKVKFKDIQLLRQVFVHRSYLNENPGFPLNHNERLEFLGDAVLELVVTENLFRTFPNPEGELTNYRSALVRGQMLAEIAQELGLGSLLYLSRGEEKGGGKARGVILANTFEAFVGALYLDQGYRPAQKFITTHLLPRLPAILEQGLHVDAKSRLQELTQEHLSITPSYRVLSESGPDHAKSFVVGVFRGDSQIGSGQGTSKQTAEQAAATDALQHWQEIAGI